MRMCNASFLAAADVLAVCWWFERRLVGAGWVVKMAAVCQSCW